MEINADFSQPASAHSADIEWLPSPMAGVDRRMLDRIGGEVARATSIVRYAQGSSFPEHTHSGGEEFIVLDGVFQDEHGDYPAGTYVRNPVGTHHIPRSDPGCTIFVKLWQFHPEDQEQFSVDLNTIELYDAPDRPGIRHAMLAYRDYEQVSLERWDASVVAELPTDGGMELFLLDGSLEKNGETFGRHDWLRFPSGKPASLRAGTDGARIWIKRGHLRQVTVPEQP
ncbi:MAG: cupin domain-containing protein [Pseudomonadota bacterium]